MSSKGTFSTPLYRPIKPDTLLSSMSNVRTVIEIIIFSQDDPGLRNTYKLTRAARWQLFSKLLENRLGWYVEDLVCAVYLIVLRMTPYRSNPLLSIASKVFRDYRLSNSSCVEVFLWTFTYSTISDKLDYFYNYSWEPNHSPRAKSLGSTSLPTFILSLKVSPP